MTAIPEAQNDIATLIDAHHESRPDAPRPHLGCSLLGHPCDRYLWLTFRWAVTPKHSGRLLRVFRRGRNEEDVIVSDLRAIGIDIRSTGGAQARVDFGCHVSGSVDGIIHSGVPGAVKTRHVAEFKTHSAKSFADLEKHGVEKSKPMHWAQMQLYMLGTECDRALYVAINKDDDRIYTERIRLDKEAAEKLRDRGHRIVKDDRMPPPISTDPAWYQCKFCDAYDFCHQTKKTENANCRTCAHSTAQEDGQWHCARHNASGIPADFQRKGCDSHVIHMDLVPWKMGKPLDQWTATWVINGKEVANGDPDANVYASTELLANAEFCASGNKLANDLRAQFPGARVVG